MARTKYALGTPASKRKAAYLKNPKAAARKVLGKSVSQRSGGSGTDYSR